MVDGHRRFGRIYCLHPQLISIYLKNTFDMANKISNKEKREASFEPGTSSICRNSILSTAMSDQSTLVARGGQLDEIR